MSWLPGIGEPRCLFDGREPLTRKLSVSRLARGPSTYEDWKTFVGQLQEIGTIVLIDDRPPSSFPIVKHYADSVLRAYIFRFEEAGIACRVAKIVV